MNIIIVEKPPVTPVSLEQLYTYLRLEPEGSPPSHPDDDDLTMMLEAATEKVEAMTNRALVLQTIRLVLPSFDPEAYWLEQREYPNVVASTSLGIELKRPPFRSMVSVKYLDLSRVEQTLDEDAYFVDEQALVPTLRPVSSWPSTYSCGDAVRIEYQVGYEPSDSPPTEDGYRENIPAALKAAIKYEVKMQYEELPPDKIERLEAAVARLTRQFTVHAFR